MLARLRLELQEIEKIAIEKIVRIDLYIFFILKLSCKSAFLILSKRLKLFLIGLKL